VHRAAHILNNHDEEEGARVVRRRFDGLLAAGVVQIRVALVGFQGGEVGTWVRG
jgi:hypothetical protein